MSAAHQILKAIRQIDHSFVADACQFIQTMLEDREQPPSVTRMYSPQAPVKRKSLFKRILSFLKKLFRRGDGIAIAKAVRLTVPQRLQESAADVFRALRQESEMAVINLAMHNARVMELMGRLACKWYGENLLVVVEKPLKKNISFSNSLNFNSIIFSPCGFLAVLMAAEAYRHQPDQPGAVKELAAIFRGIAGKQRQLETGDIILIRLLDRYLTSRNRIHGQQLFASQLKEYDTFKLLTAPPSLFAAGTKIKWWGLANCIVRCGSAYPRNMTAYICQRLLDSRQESMTRDTLAKWSSCFKALLKADNGGEPGDIKNYLSTMTPEERDNIKDFCSHFLSMFKRLLFYEALARAEPTERERICSNTDMEIYNHFIHWLTEDLNRYIDDYFNASGSARSHHEGQRVEKEQYNVYYKFVFTALSEIIGPNDLLNAIDSIQYGFGTPSAP